MLILMQSTHAIRLPLLASTRFLGLTIGASLLIALSAQAAIPVAFSPVPLTLQSLAVVLVGATLGPWRGAAAAALYVLEGALGLPFFAQGRSGMAVLLGPTAGYLYAFPVAAFIAGYARGPILRISGCVAAAMAVIHLGGWSWLAGPMGLGAEKALATGGLPFLINDAVKFAIAVATIVATQRLRRKNPSQP